MLRKKILGVSIAILIIMVLSLTLACSQPAATTAQPPTSSIPTTSASAISAPATSAPAAANSGQVIKLRFALFQPPVHILSITNTEYAKEIETRTNGRVQITVSQGGSLLGAPAMYEGIKNGIVDMGNTNTQYNPGKFPFTEISTLPVLANDGWVTTNASYDFIMKYQPKEWNDVHLLNVYCSANEFMGILTVKKPMLKLEDWKGKVIRAQGVNGLMVTALGATIKNLALADTYDALSKGVVDGVVSSPETLDGWKFGDVCKYISLSIGAAQPTPVFYNAMNKDKWNSLPPDIQKAITDVSDEYKDKLVLGWDKAQIEGLQYAKNAGDSIVAIPPDEINRWMALITPIIDNYLKDLTTKGYTQQEVNDAWSYFQSRVQFWNGQLAQNNITPLVDQERNFSK